MAVGVAEQQHHVPASRGPRGPRVQAEWLGGLSSLETARQHLVQQARHTPNHMTAPTRTTRDQSYTIAGTVPVGRCCKARCSTCFHRRVPSRDFVAHRSARSHARRRKTVAGPSREIGLCKRFRLRVSDGTRSLNSKCSQADHSETFALVLIPHHGAPFIFRWVSPATGSRNSPALK